MAFKITEADFEKVYGKKSNTQEQASAPAHSVPGIKITEADFDKVYGAERQRAAQQQAQTAGVNTPAVSYAEKVTGQAQPEVNNKPAQKYGLIDGKVVLPSSVENQGLRYAPGTEKSKGIYLMDSAAKGLVGGVLQAGEAMRQDLTGETGKAKKAYYDYVKAAAYNPQLAGEMKNQTAQLNQAKADTKLRTDTLGYKMLESSEQDMLKATEGMGRTGQFLTTGVAGSVLQNAYLAPLYFNPATAPIALGIMAMSAAGRTAKEQADSGKPLDKALIRGVMDGTIEFLTERIGMDAVAKLITGKGDNIVKEILRSVISEAGEEGASYALGYFADRVDRNTKEKVDWEAFRKELGLNMLAGGLSGGLLAGGGMAVGGMGHTLGAPVAQQTQTEAKPDQAGVVTLPAPQVQPVTDTNVGTIVPQTEQAVPQADDKGVVTLPATQADNVKVHTEDNKKANSKELLDKLRASIPDLSGESISHVKGDEFPKSNVSIVEQVGQFFKSLGNKVSRVGFGDIIINERTVKDDIAHGIGRAKSATFKAVPDILAKGKQIDYQQNWKGRGYDTYVFAGQIDYAGKPAYVAAVVTKGDDNRFYLHEVLDENGNIIFTKKETGLIKTGVTAQGGITGEPASNDIIPQGNQTMQDAVVELPENSAKDNNVPDKTAADTNVGARPVETINQERDRIISTESNAARKALHRKKLVDSGNERTAKYLDSFEKRTGIKVWLYDGSEHSWGFEDGRNMYLNIENPDIVLKTMAHEAVHIYRKGNEKKYTALKKRVLKLEKDNGSKFWEEAYWTRKDYAQDYETDDPIDEEIVARLCEMCLDDPEGFLDTLGREKTIIETIRDVLRTIKNNITIALTNSEQAKIDNALIALDKYLRSDAAKKSSAVKSSKKADTGRYMELAKNPQANEEELRKMVDEAAKKAGYTYKAYHGTNGGDFNVFDWEHTQRADAGFYGRGHYFATRRGEAAMYGDRVVDAYLKLGKVFDFQKEMYTIDGHKQNTDSSINFTNIAFMLNAAEKIPEVFADKTLDLYNYSEGLRTIKWSELKGELNKILDDGSFKIIQYADGRFKWTIGDWKQGTDKYTYEYFDTREEAENNKYNAATEFLVSRYNIDLKLDPAAYYIGGDMDGADAFTSALKNKGYNSVMQAENGDEIVVFESSQIKSADPVTYDNEGNIIPLEERFNAKEPDIRFSKKREADKSQQFEILQKTNPMQDDYHTGIRSVDDIHTAEEVFTEDEFMGTPDWSFEDAQAALKKGKVTVYSSYPIAAGVFVTPSKMTAQDYAGKGKIYSKEVPLESVAWIDSDEGQYAPVDGKMDIPRGFRYENGYYVPAKGKVIGEKYDGGEAVGMDGVKYSLKSARHDFVDDGQIMDDLVNYGILTPDKAKEFKANIEKVLDTVLAHPQALDMNEEYSKSDRPYESFKPNSDPLYKVSLDFSTMCKKRLMTQYLIESLQTKLAQENPDTKAISAEETLAIRERLLQLRKDYKDIEVACGLCYVEAARLKSPKQINTFLDKANREKMMRKYFAKQNVEFNKSIEEFKRKAKVEAGFDADQPLSSLPGNVKRRIDNNVKMQRERYTPSAQEQAIIDKAMKMENIQFLTVDNLTRMSVNEPEIYRAFTGFVRDSTRSKSVQSGVPYYYGDSTEQGLTDKLIELMNKENGLRHQSWSDFETVHLLDTITAICELSIRGAKMHAYTKVPNFIRLVGDTGMMINISLIPEGETGIENGKLVYSPIEGMDYNTAKQLREEHSATSGTICIGINDKQINMLLDDDTIDYVIPYHASGMNKKLRGMAKVSGWSDYQSKQSEKLIAGATNKDNNSDWHKKPDFSEWFNEAEIDTSKSGVEIMREAAEKYKQLCAERGLHPKFMDFVNHPNYWKLLIDRKMVDHKTGKIIIQQPVRPNFDFDVINTILSEEVAKYDSDLKKTLVDELYKNWKDGTIKAIEGKLVANEKANTAKRKALKNAKLSGQDAMAVAAALGDDAFNINNITDNSVYGKLLKFDAKASRKIQRGEIPQEHRKMSGKELNKMFREQATKKAGSDLPESVGAMKSGYYAAIEEYGAFPEGEKVTNPVDVPMSVDGVHGVTRGVRSIMEAAATKEDMLSDYETAIANGEFNYDINRDKDAVEKAVAYIEKYGFRNTYNEWRKKIDNKQTITKDDMTQAQIMYASAVAEGDYDIAMKLATDIAVQATKAGQVVQSMRILKKTTPDGRLYYAQKSVEAIQDDVNEKYGDKSPKLEVPQELLDNLKKAKTDEEIRKATAEINQAIADQLPFSWSNFINSWRYLAMLGNTRTQVRNIASNIIGTVAQEYTNFVQTGIEKALSGKGVEKTSAVKTTAWQRKQAEEDYKAVRETLHGAGKYRNDTLQGIQKLQNPFDFKGKGGKAGKVVGDVLTKWNDVTNWAMDEGDKLFSRPAYMRYYARYLAANNITSEKQLTGKVKLRARAWATKQAKEAVYREENALAKWISGMEKDLAQSNKATVRTGAKIVGGIMPFRGTPLNITKRAFEYTPVGIAMELINNKNSNPVETINKAAKSLSGTSLIVLGYALAKSGILTGGLGDDKEDKMKEQMGQQPYSVNVGNYSYTLDWGGAGIMPLFIGAEMYNSTAEDSENFLMALLDTFANSSAPIMETSMMTGLMDALKTASYEDNMAESITSFLASGLSSYIGQFVPTLFGQVARAVDDTSRSSYTNVKGVMKPLAKTVQKMENKIPLLSKTNVPYMDVWGKEVKNFGGSFRGRLAYNMLSPGYAEKKSIDKVEKMLYDLYDKTGETSVLPSNYTTYKRMGGETIRFSDKQYEQYTKEYGQTAYGILDDLAGDKGFKSMEDAYRAAVVEKVYKYSTAIASNEVVDKELEARQANQQKALEKGVSAQYVFGGLLEADGMGSEGNANGSLSKSEVMAYIESRGGLSNAEKAYLFAALGNSNWKNPYV